MHLLLLPLAYRLVLVTIAAPLDHQCGIPVFCMCLRVCLWLVGVGDPIGMYLLANSGMVASSRKDIILGN